MRDYVSAITGVANSNDRCFRAVFIHYVSGIGPKPFRISAFVFRNKNVASLISFGAGEDGVDRTFPICFIGDDGARPKRPTRCCLVIVIDALLYVDYHVRLISLTSYRVAIQVEEFEGCVFSVARMRFNSLSIRFVSIDDDQFRPSNCSGRIVSCAGQLFTYIVSVAWLRFTNAQTGYLVIRYR